MSGRLVVSLPHERLLNALEGTPDVEFVLWDFTGTPPRQDFDLVVAPYLDGPSTYRVLEGLNIRLVQHQSIGFDGVQDSLPEGMPLANAATVHEPSTAELAVGLALAMQRGIPDAVRDGDQRVWNPVLRPSLADRSVLLVGYGGVSKAIEARLAPFEVHFTRVAQTSRKEQGPSGENVHVHGINELPQLLPGADIVIVAVPLTNDTRHLIDAEALAAMTDGALLINVARGPVVDTDALVAELQSERLRAGLDVTDPEPLPTDHPLWSCPNTLITPHVGGDTTAMLPRVAALVRRQIDHLRAGETPENLVIQ